MRTTLLTRSLAAAGGILLLAGSLASAAPAGASAPQRMSALASGHRVNFLTHAAWRSQHLAAGTSRSASSPVLSAHGGEPQVVTGPPLVYVVFWGSQWGSQGIDANANATFTGDLSSMAPRLQQLYKGLGTNGELWSGVMTQYCSGVSNGTTVCPSGAQQAGYPANTGTLAGVWYDSSAAAPSAATQNQLATEAANAAVHFGNATTAANRSVQYVVVSPTGTHPDSFNTPSGQFCAWHSYATTSTGFSFAFTNLPYIPDMGASCGANYVNGGSAGLLDGVTIVGGHEYAETLTDQTAGGGWYDNATGGENGDLCSWVGVGGTGGAQNVAFATGSFAMQATWSNDANGCQISHPVVGSSGAASDFSILSTPTSVSASQGTSASTNISTATTSGAAETVSLAASGLPAGASASFSPTSVTSGGSATLTLTTSPSTPTGSYPITVTGTAASGSHTTAVTLTVSAATASSFSISLSPTSGTASRGGSRISTTVKTTTTSGAAQKVTLSVSGAPSGVSVRLGTSSLTSGSSTTLRLSASTQTVPGTYTITVKGTGTSGSQSATYRLTVI